MFRNTDYTFNLRGKHAMSSFMLELYKIVSPIEEKQGEIC